MMKVREAVQDCAGGTYALLERTSAKLTLRPAIAFGCVLNRRRAERGPNAAPPRPVPAGDSGSL
jgi:hypothetical protein